MRGRPNKVIYNFDIVVTWQIGNVISPLPHALRTPNLAGWWLRMKEPHPKSHVTLQYRSHVTNKKRYIYIFTRPMDPNLAGWWLRMRKPHLQSQVTLWLCGHVKNQKYFIFTVTRRKAHKLSRVSARTRWPHPTYHVTPRSRRHVTVTQ